MITFKQQFTFPEESIKGFAIFIGWTEQIPTTIEVVDQEETELQQRLTHFETVMVDNPISFIEYVRELTRTHTLQLTKQWAESLKNDALNAQINALKETLEPTLHSQIIEVVENALIDEIIIGPTE